MEGGSLSLDVQGVIRVWIQGLPFLRPYSLPGWEKTWHSRSHGGEEACGDSYDPGREEPVQ